MKKLGRPRVNSSNLRITKGFSIDPCNLEFIQKIAKEQGKTDSFALNSMIETIRKLRGE